MHKKLCSVVAATALVATGLFIPQAAHAVPDVPRPTPPDSMQSERLNVTILLDHQPETVSVANETTVKESQEALIKRLQDRYDITIKRRFGYLVNGFSATVPSFSLPALANEAGVASVVEEQLYYPTDMNADALTQATKVREELDYHGEGQVISIIDTGVDVSHQDMKLAGQSDDGSCGTANYVKIKKIMPGFTCKVPAGYNYPDSNVEVKDTASAHPHGMHVAGIAAANSEATASPNNTSPTERVTGSAPNAQVLAMKVFSNVPALAGGASNDNIIAALEDSAKLGADVVNMSLGSANGFSDPRDGVAIAIKKLTDQGVSVVVAAGNDGLSTSNSGNEVDSWGQLDNAAVGGPSTAPHAFSVAAINNSATMQTQASAQSGNTTFAFPYSLATGTTPTGAVKLMDAGIGQPEDFKDKDFHGRYALIKRGAISFADKFKNASDAGAEGVILYNHEAGGETFVGMAGIESFTFFSASLRNSDGVKLAAMLAANPETTVTFSNTLTSVAKENSETPAYFTSWGPTPSLDFKPQIGGIGGDVYSTFNDNGYGTLSGTSMASPHVAGMNALILQAYHERFADMPATQRVHLSQLAMMNTAKILTHDDIPYSVRQVGSGLAQIYNAIKTNVFASVDNEGYVSLREINGTKSFTVTLTNQGDTEARFTVPQPKVVNETAEVNQAITTFWSTTDSISVNKDTVVVPAHGSVDVDVKVATSGDDHWMNGYVIFESATAGQPSLHIPYLGYVGDWGSAEIVQKPGDGLFQKLYEGQGWFGPQPNPSKTQLAAYDTVPQPRLSPLDENPWISPNGDGFRDQFMPIVALHRNAEMAEMNITDKNGNRIIRVGEAYNLRRPVASRMAAEPGKNVARILYEGIWDAKVFDAEKGYTPLPDGEYFYQVRTRVRDTDDWQDTNLPFRVDQGLPEASYSVIMPTPETSSPQTPSASPEKSPEVAPTDEATVVITASDSTSGLLSNEGFLCSLLGACGVTGYSAGSERIPVEQVDATTFTMKVSDASTTPYVVAYVQDQAGNTTKLYIPIMQSAAVVVDKMEAISDARLNPSSADIKDGVLTLNGWLNQGDNSAISKIRIKGNEFDIDRSGTLATWVGTVALEQGDNHIVVEGINSSGGVVTSTPVNLIYDAIPPEVTITSKIALDDKGRPVLTNGKVHLTGTYKDDLGVVGTLYAAGASPVMIEDGTWEVDVPVQPHDSSVSVVAFDRAGNSTKVTSEETWTPEAGPAPTAPKAVQISFDEAVQQSAQIYAYPTSYEGINWDEHTLTVTGTLSGEVSSLTVTPAARAVAGENGAPGHLVFHDPVKATLGSVSQDGKQSFSVTLPQDKAMVGYRFVAQDAHDETLHDASYRFIADRELPKVHFTKPTLKNMKIVTNQKDVTFAGSISDNGPGYTLQINGNKVRQISDFESMGSETNARSFSWTQDAQKNPVTLVEATDVTGNAWRALVETETDFTLPTVATEGLTEMQIVRDPSQVTFKATSEDKNNESLTLSLDGNAVAEARGNWLVTGLDEALIAPAEFAKLLGQDGHPGSRGVKASDTPEGTTENPDAPVDGSADGAAYGTAVATVEPTLKVSHTPTEANTGLHTYTVTSVDAAGNEVRKEVSFMVDKAPMIVGDDNVTVTIDLNELDNLDTLTQRVVDLYKVEDDTENATLHGSFSGSVAEGDNSFTLVASDGMGDPVTRTVTVKLVINEHTYTAEGASFTGKTRADDEVQVKVTKINDQVTRVEFMNGRQFATVQGTITIDAPEGSQLFTVTNGVRMPMTAEWKDGHFTFAGGSRSSFEVVAPAGPPASVPDVPLVIKGAAKAPVPAQAPFKDVSASQLFAGEMAWMREAGISTGWSDGTYHPYEVVRRDAMAAFLYRMAGEPSVTAAPGTSFRDVPAGGQFERAIAWMKESGISTGWSDGTFRPTDTVRRDAMAAFLYRFTRAYPAAVAGAVAQTAAPEVTPSEQVFADVSGRTAFAKEMAWMKKTFISTGWSDGTYRPLDAVRRDAMAAFLYRMVHNRGVSQP